MGTKVAMAVLATQGNEVASSCQELELPDKSRAVRCWQAVVTASGLDDKVIASECGMKPDYYSKVATGKQGDLLDLVYRLPPSLRAMRHEFFARLCEDEQIDLEARAAEQLTVAAIRFLRVRGAVSVQQLARQSALSEITGVRTR